MNNCKKKIGMAPPLQVLQVMTRGKLPPYDGSEPYITSPSPKIIINLTINININIYGD
jgi:hypothetical protein